jgi:hypothetical protein
MRDSKATRGSPKNVLPLPDLDHSKASALQALTVEYGDHSACLPWISRFSSDRRLDPVWAVP